MAVTREVKWYLTIDSKSDLPLTTHVQYGSIGRINTFICCICYEDAFLQNVMQIVCQIHKKIMNNCAHNSVYAFMPFPVASGNEVLVGQQFLLQYI